MFPQRVPLSTDERIVIRLASDPEWTAQREQHHRERLCQGEWSPEALTCLRGAWSACTEPVEGSVQLDVDRLVVPDGWPPVDGVALDGAVDGWQVATPSPEVVKAIATALARIDAARWQDAGEWPDGAPGDVASAVIRPLSPRDRAAIEAQMGPRPRGEVEHRSWLARQGVMLCAAQWESVHQGGEVVGATAFLDQVTAADPLLGDRLRGEVAAHLRRMWGAPLELGKGGVELSGSAASAAGAAKPSGATSAGGAPLTASRA